MSEDKRSMLYGMGLLLIALWGLWPSFGPWVPVEATVVGLSHDYYQATDEDEQNEYYAVLHICYDFQNSLWYDQLYLQHDGPTGWKLQSLSEAVQEARRHPVGEVREILVHGQDPSRWGTSSPQIWVWVLLIITVGAATVLLAHETPGLQVALLCVAVGLAYLARTSGSATELSPEQDPRPLVKLCQTPRAFERVPIGGAKKTESLKHTLEQWGRPDLVWIEVEDGRPVGQLEYREGETWETTWTLNFHLVNGEFQPLGPPLLTE